MLEKALNFEVDFVVADLEDSVPPAEKTTARNMVAEMTPLLRDSGQHVMVRINALDTGLTAEDLEAVVSDSIEMISVGKINTVNDVKEYDRLLTRAEKSAGLTAESLKLVLWIESAPAVQNAYEIATTSSCIAAVTFGS